MPLMQVLVSRETDDLDPEDLHVEGVYAIEVDDVLPSSSWVSSALDCFHESVPIACLDDFCITVRDSLGQPVEEDENQPSYTLGAFGDFLGMIHNQPPEEGATA